MLLQDRQRDGHLQHKQTRRRMHDLKTTKEWNAQKMPSICWFAVLFPKIKLVKAEKNFSHDFTITAIGVYPE